MGGGRGGTRTGESVYKETKYIFFLGGGGRGGLE